MQAVAVWHNQQVSYNDPSPKPSAAAVKGVCVECVSSCDCPVNQYCGIGDIKVSKEMSSNGGTAGPPPDRLGLRGLKSRMREIAGHGTRR